MKADLNKTSHCCGAKLDLLGFCTKCKEGCKPMDVIDTSTVDAIFDSLKAS